MGYYAYKEAETEFDQKMSDELDVEEKLQLSLRR